MHDPKILTFIFNLIIKCKIYVYMYFNKFTCFRIDATREMCNLLKDHSAVTEERLQKCKLNVHLALYIIKIVPVLGGNS